VLRESKTYLYMHIVWATWDRLPLLVGEVKSIAYQCIERECEAMKVTVMAIGGIEDHVHLLIDIPPTLPVADLMKQVKGSSAHFVHNRPGGDTFFKWQGAYAAYSVS
jgi:REP element-mobilizing transposase RayT